MLRRIRELLIRMAGESSPRLVLLWASLAMLVAFAVRAYPVTAALLCLLAVGMIAQSFGTNRGFAAVAICAAFLYLVVFPLAPYLIKEVSTTAFIAIASAFCFMQGRLRLREKELAVARERLYQALFDSISHDLRIPLVSITGVLTGLLDENFADEPETRRDLMENALTEAERLRSLVDNLLRMTRLTAGELRVVKKPYDLWEVATAVLDDCGPQLKGRSVVLEVPDELPLVPQDPILIGQVLRNLLDNALKYSPSHSELRLEISRHSDRVKVALTDRGPGISQKDEGRVFEKFYRGENQRTHGSGLGLSICQGLVVAHGGVIEVGSRPGGGTTASFSLPLKEGVCLKS